MLNDFERDRLQILVNDEMLMKAVFKVFEETIETNKPKVNESDNNAILGEKYRSYELSKQMVDDGFRQLMTYQQQNLKIKKLNRAI